MATIYQADIRPTKLELIDGWLPGQAWYAGEEHPQLRAVGAYRFDDPHGEVGIETHLVRAGGGPLLHVPMTYRDAPLPDAEQWLIGTMEHSVLGRRWVYDACGDPVYVTALVAMILGAGTQAEELVEVDGWRERRTPTVSVTGSSSAGNVVSSVEEVEQVSSYTDNVQTVIHAVGFELAIRRVVDHSVHIADGHTLTGTWADQAEPVLLVTARRAD